MSCQVYANAHGVKIIGDMPIYVGGQSADVWANRHLFELNEETCEPGNVSGVPPDAFSETGQLWGSPLYRWVILQCLLHVLLLRWGWLTLILSMPGCMTGLGATLHV